MIIFIVVIMLFVILCVGSLVLNHIMFQPVKSGNWTHHHEDYFNCNQTVHIKSWKHNLTGYLYGKENQKGLIIISSGMGVTSDDYLPMILEFVRQGYAVLSYDNIDEMISVAES